MSRPLIPYEFAVGQRVKGEGCLGDKFEGVVTKCPTPYTVLIDDAVFVPVSLIERPESAGVFD